MSALRLTDADVRVWLALCFGGGLLFVVGLTIAAGLAVFIGNVAGDLEPPALQALHEANLLVDPWTVRAGAFLLGAGAGVRSPSHCRGGSAGWRWFSESWPRSQITSSAAPSTTSGSSGRRARRLDARRERAVGPPRRTQHGVAGGTAVAQHVVGPEEPFDGRSQEDMERDHWACRPGSCDSKESSWTRTELKGVPHDVVLSGECVHSSA